MQHPVLGDDGLQRCGWCAGHDDYQAYHDAEWGYPVADDRRLFEKICLEGFQSGLSWLTILRKREHFRRAFAGFDIDAVAAFSDGDRARLLADAGIVRHRGKIDAAINNAHHARVLRERHGSLAAFFWSFEPARRPPATPLPAETPESQAMSKALKAAGWRFVGPTTCYAFMQAMGLVNDHHPDCAFHSRATAARQAFKTPA